MHDYMPPACRLHGSGKRRRTSELATSVTARKKIAGTVARCSLCWVHRSIHYAQAFWVPAMTDDLLFFDAKFVVVHDLLSRGEIPLRKDDDMLPLDGDWTTIVLDLNHLRIAIRVAAVIHETRNVPFDGRVKDCVLVKTEHIAIAT
eukprot:scaffold178499_cov30-Tisochrysis_lutea.AAC.9